MGCSIFRRMLGGVGWYRLSFLSAVLLLLTACYGQEPRTVSVQAQDAEVRQVLKMMFEQSGVNYVIDPTVQGKVTVNLRDVPFDTALRLVLKQVKAEYVVEAGVYVIRPRAEISVEVGAPMGSEVAVEPSAERVGVYQIYHADPFVIVMLLRGEQPMSPEWWTLYNLYGGSMLGFGAQGPGLPGSYGGSFGAYGTQQGGVATGSFGQGVGPGGLAFRQGLGSGPGIGSRPGGGSVGGRGRGGPGESGRGMSAGSGGGVVEDGTLLVDPSTNRIIYVPSRI